MWYCGLTLTRHSSLYLMWQCCKGRSQVSFPLFLVFKLIVEFPGFVPILIFNHLFELADQKFFSRAGGQLPSIALGCPHSPFHQYFSSSSSGIYLSGSFASHSFSSWVCIKFQIHTSSHACPLGRPFGKDENMCHHALPIHGPAKA